MCARALSLSPLPLPTHPPVHFLTAGCSDYVEKAVSMWLKNGGARLDCANSYQNQKSVGTSRHDLSPHSDSSKSTPTRCMFLKDLHFLRLIVLHHYLVRVSRTPHHATLPLSASLVAPRLTIYFSAPQAKPSKTLTLHARTSGSCKR